VIVFVKPGDRSSGDRLRVRVRQSRRTGTRSSAEHDGRVREVRREWDLFVRRPSSSSRTSGSMPCRPPRRKQKNPQRDMPIGMLGSLAICTVLYVLMSLVMTGLAPFHELNVPHPVVVALAQAPQLGWLPAVHQRRSDRRSGNRSCWSCSWGSPGSSSRCRVNGLLPAIFGARPPAIPDAVHHDDRDPVSSRRSWPDCSRSTFWASWCRSARCSRS